jgi:hypothetical protein
VPVENGQSEDEQSKRSRRRPCCVVLLPGQYTTVPLDGLPTTPAEFSSGMLDSALGTLTIPPGGVFAPWPIIGGITGVGAATVGGLAIQNLGSSPGGAVGTFTNLPSGLLPVDCAWQTYEQENSISVPSPICPP